MPTIQIFSVKENVLIFHILDQYPFTMTHIHTKQKSEVTYKTQGTAFNKKLNNTS